MRQQRDGRVFPTGRFAHVAELIGQRFRACAREEQQWSWLACRGGYLREQGKAGRLAAGRLKVLSVEVAGRQGIAQVFDVRPLAYAEVKIATADGGGQVNALA